MLHQIFIQFCTKFHSISHLSLFSFFYGDQDLLVPKEEVTNLNTSNRLTITEKKVFMAKCPNMINHRNLPFSYLTRFHNSFIKPSLTSGLSALPLSSKNISKLVNFEKCLIRHMFGLRKNSPISQLFLFLGMESVETSLKRDTLSLFYNSWLNSDNPVTQ